MEIRERTLVIIPHFRPPGENKELNLWALVIRRTESDLPLAKGHPLWEVTTGNGSFRLESRRMIPMVQTDGTIQDPEEAHQRYLPEMTIEIVLKSKGLPLFGG